MTRIRLGVFSSDNRPKLTWSQTASLSVILVFPVLIGVRLWDKASGAHFAVVENDNALYMRHAQALSRLTWPWSSSDFLSFPDFSRTWRIESIPSALTELYVWASGRIFGPTFALNSYALLGIVSIGIATFCLCRALSISRFVSYVAVILVQCLPVFRQMLLTGMAATWSATFPITTLAILVNASVKNWTKIRSARIGSFVVGLSFFQSTVSFYFSFLIFIIWISIELKEILGEIGRLSRKVRLSIILCLAFAIISVGLLLSYLLQLTKSEYGVPYAIYSRLDVLKDSYTLLRYVTPDPFHLLFAGGSWEPEGYSQQYGGLVLTIIGLLSFLIVRRRSHELLLLRLSVVVFLALSLGQFSIWGLTIPSAREFFRFLMIGNRRFAIAGIVVQCLVVVFAALALNNLFRNRQHIIRSRIAIGLIFLISLLDLNPLSRLFVNNYSSRYETIRTSLDELPDSGLLVTQDTERPKNFYVFDQPIFTDEVGALSHAVGGSNELFAYLKSQGVDFILANTDTDGNPVISAFIQNSIRLNLPLSDQLFLQAAPALTLETFSDDGKSERKWDVQLVKLSSIGQNSTVSSKRLAQFVSNPILEVPYSEMERRKVEIEWATNSELDFSFEPLDNSFERTGREEIEFHMELVPPPSGSTPVRIVVTSEEGSIPMLLDSTGKKIIVKSNLVSTVHIKVLDPCPVAEDASAGNLIGRPICFGLKEFAVLER